MRGGGICRWVNNEKLRFRREKGERKKGENCWKNGIKGLIVIVLPAPATLNVGEKMNLNTLKTADVLD